MTQNFFLETIPVKPSATMGNLSPMKLSWWHCWSSIKVRPMFIRLSVVTFVNL